jgi:hypothetical protein
MPSIGSCGLGSGKITTAAEERDKRGRERNHREVEKNDECVLYGVLILF